jgi:cytochrome P450
MTLDINLFAPEMLADPYSTYRQLRIEDPVHWHQPIGAWILTSYEDVDYALHEPRFSSKLEVAWMASTQKESTGGILGRDKSQQSLYTFVNNSLVFSDPPQHTRLRALVSKAFTPRAIEASKQLITTLLDDFLDAVAGNGSMDIVRDLAYPLPLAVIGSVLGVPLDAPDRDRIKRWCDEFLVPFGRDPATLTADERQRAQSSAVALRAFAHELVQEVRAKPRDDLLSALVEAAEAGERLSEDELFATIVLFLIAGHENLTSLLSNGVLALLKHPEQLNLIKGGRVTWKDAVHELMRYVSPNQFIQRRAIADVVLRDKTIQQEQVLMLVLAAANRDPDRFPEPDHLDVTRPPDWNLALGHGPHYCLGAPLAELEAEIIFNRLFNRFPKLQLASNDWEYENNFNVRLLKSLPVNLNPSRTG